MERRQFIKSSLLTAAVLSMKPSAINGLSVPQKKYASDKVNLGNTGIIVSRMAIGTGTNGYNNASNQTRKLGLKGMGDLLQAAYEQGIFFWDTADQYGSHPHIKEGLTRVSRENVVILTKTHASTEKEMKDDLDRFRKELGTDHIDVILLHCMEDNDWPEKKKGAMEYLMKARQEGIIKAHGVSCHTFGALKAAEASEWVQVDLARINPAGVIMDSDVNSVTTVLKNMKKSGKAVMGMKILGAGQLVTRKMECLNYALSQEYLDCFTIGIESHDQLADLIKRIPEASMLS
jgi:predicted aldo/keto reductase-like oxidoreductase